MAWGIQDQLEKVLDPTHCSPGFLDLFRLRERGLCSVSCQAHAFRDTLFTKEGLLTLHCQ